MTKAKGGYKIREDGKKDTGRPTKLTPETILLLEQAFSMGLIANALDKNGKHFYRSLDVRSFAQSTCASLRSLSVLSDIIGIFFKAHVLEKYVNHTV